MGVVFFIKMESNQSILSAELTNLTSEELIAFCTELQTELRSMNSQFQELSKNYDISLNNQNELKEQNAKLLEKIEKEDKTSEQNKDELGRLKLEYEELRKITCSLKNTILHHQTEATEFGYKINNLEIKHTEQINNLKIQHTRKINSLQMTINNLNKTIEGSTKDWEVFDIMTQEKDNTIKELESEIEQLKLITKEQEAENKRILEKLVLTQDNLVEIKKINSQLQEGREQLNNLWVSKNGLIKTLKRNVDTMQKDNLKLSQKNIHMQVESGTQGKIIKELNKQLELLKMKLAENTKGIFTQKPEEGKIQQPSFYSAYKPNSYNPECTLRLPEINAVNHSTLREHHSKTGNQTERGYQQNKI